MSTALTVLGQNDIQKGGLGLDSSIFKITPSTVEVVQKTTHQQGAIHGKLRITDTNQHFDEMHVVLLAPPTEQRAYFEGVDFSGDNKLCFSLDNLEPHPKAKVMQSMKCGYYKPDGRYQAICSKASWDKYNQTENSNDKPKCKSYWHCSLADRVTQLPLFLNVRGTSIAPFKKSMGNVAKVIALMRATAQAENRALAATNAEVKAALEAGQSHPLLKPMPSIFDVSFTLYVVPIDAYYQLGIKNIAPMKQEDRAAFGALFLEYANRPSYAEQEAEEQAAAEADEATVDAAVMEPPSSSAVVGEIVI